MSATLAMPLVAGAMNVGSGDYSTYSIEQLEALIGKLQKQLDEMKKGSKCFVSDKDLSLGDGEPGDALDSHVRRLQDFLREKGFMAYKSTGYFGKMTRGALVSFQKSAGIAQSGEFDDSTRSKAHSLYCTTSGLKEQPKPKAETPKPSAPGAVRSISLTADGSGVRWTADGVSSMGFKVVWSKNAGPTYPTRDGDQYQYLSEPTASSASGLEAFAGAGTYYVRVCEYLGGACGVYSNQITLQL